MKTLETYIKQPFKPFTRGTSDCCSWVAIWCETLTGKPFGREFLIPMNTKQALILLKKHGGMHPLWKKTLEKHNFKKSTLKEAKDGDIVLFNHKSCFTKEEGVGIKSKNKVLTIGEKATIYLLDLTEIKIEGVYTWA